MKPTDTLLLPVIIITIKPLPEPIPKISTVSDSQWKEAMEQVGLPA